MRFPVFRNRPVHLLAVIRHKPVVLKHETAFHYIIVGNVTETRIGDGFPEPFEGFTKILLPIVDISGPISRRSSEVRQRTPVNLSKPEQSPVKFTGLKVTIGLLEQILVKPAASYARSRYGLKKFPGPLVVLRVKKIQGMKISHLRDKHRIRML